MIADVAAPAMNAMSEQNPVTTRPMSPSDRLSASADTTPDICDVYCPDRGKAAGIGGTRDKREAASEAPVVLVRAQVD
jgi:hypothetical protein